FEARQVAELSFERPGTIAEILVREGNTVTEGQIMARLDTRLLLAERRRLEASRASTEAQAELARRTNMRQVELRDRGFATEQTVDDTSLTLARLQAGIAEIDAALSALDIDLSKSELIAPFAGTVGARGADVGSVASPGTIVASLVETAPARFHVGLDPASAALLAEGQDAVIRAAGLMLPARLSGLAPSLDPTTRARLAFFDVIVGPMPPDRTTGEIALRQRVDQPGAWVALSALRPGPRATWTLLTVEDGRVGMEAAEILHLEEDRVFVRGTFRDGVAYLPDGIHRVVPGQSVIVRSTDGTSGEAVAWAR
ncbi:MAG: efflux RND transporter periplasmic adaptor subunit, partial [Jannaschia sp.]